MGSSGTSSHGRYAMKDVQDFIAGFKEFQQGWVGPDAELYEHLKKGQNPRALLIGCSDSRVDPAILTRCAPGDLFVVRNVANLVPPCEHDASYHGVSAALEYAVCHLQVEHIIVMGHSQCGGIRALMEGSLLQKKDSFIGKWVSLGIKAKERVLSRLPGKSFELQVKACERTAILLSLENLMTFPWLQARVEQGRLALHGWYFDMETGSLSGYCTASKSFEVLA